MKRFFLFLFSLTFLPLMATTAHAATEFKIVEGLDDQALKEVMEKNVNAMLLAFKTAADEPMPSKVSRRSGKAVP